jgi:plastocyanin
MNGRAKGRWIVRIRGSRIGALIGLIAMLGGTFVWAWSGTASSSLAHSSHAHTVVIPDTDKFTPYHITIRVGDTVTWVNNDTDDHSVVSDDMFNTEGHEGVNHVIPGTDNNGGQSGMFTLRFTHLGTFVYYCRFHSHLDADAQPVAPGPDGGIQDANGNFGTPMTGIVSVVRHAG